MCEARGVQVLTLGKLRARVVAPPAPTRVVVLLHGFGAPGDDLVDLAKWIDVPDDTAWVFPEGPLELGGLYGDSRAWWMLDLARLERDLARGQPSDRSGEHPEGLPEARAAMIELLDDVAARFPQAQLVLGGFSQGAMLALDVALHDPRPLAALVLLSGTLLARTEWEPKFPSRAGLPVFQSHGSRDALLPYRSAELLRDLLTAAGLRVAWYPFDGGHEIPPPLLDEIAELIAAATGRPPGTG
jgi:phospholipase/carboxylesterase